MSVWVWSVLSTPKQSNAFTNTIRHTHTYKKMKRKRFKAIKGTFPTVGSNNLTANHPFCREILKFSTTFLLLQRKVSKISIPSPPFFRFEFQKVSKTLLNRICRKIELFYSCTTIEILLKHRNSTKESCCLHFQTLPKVYTFYYSIFFCMKAKETKKKNLINSVVE